MVILFVATIITGFASSNVNPDGGGPHTGVAILFIISTIAHSVVNRKLLVRHVLGPAKNAD
jgi:hypothetical protein